MYLCSEETNQRMDAIPMRWRSKYSSNMTCLLMSSDITGLFAYCNCGNFNIHIWCGLAISSAKEGKSGLIYNLVKS